MKFALICRYVLIFGLFVFGFNLSVQGNEVKKEEATQPVISSHEHSEGAKIAPEGHKNEGHENSKNEALPPCKGGYSKIHWTGCRGLKKEYNGPHFVGQSYEGDFKEGRPHGRGEIKYIDGTRFAGSFELGIREGKGAEYAKDGSLTLEGFWRAGVLVKIVQGAPKDSHAEKESAEVKEGPKKSH